MNINVTLEHIYNYEKNVQNTTVSTQYLEQAIKDGTCTQGGKHRIVEIFKNFTHIEKRVEALKKEYYYAGQRVPIKWNGYAGYDSRPNGYNVYWYDKGVKRVCTLSWVVVLECIEQLIINGTYESGMLHG